MNMGALVCLFSGFVLLYGAIKNRQPLDVIKRAITGQPVSGALPFSPTGPTNATGGTGQTNNPTGGTGVINQLTGPTTPTN